VAAPQHANARPGSSRTAGPTLKLHRRVVSLRGRDHTVLTLRPVARARFSTNYFHDTWHVLSDGHGAPVLARLLWGLSYQARPGTLILLDEARLDPNPFDAEPAMLVALVPAGLTGCSAPMLRELKHTAQRHAAPAGTVRWRTHGLDLAAGTDRALWRGAPRARVEVVSGVLVVSADRDGLRELALDAAALTRLWYNGQSYMEIDYPRGEVQIWREYHRMVAIAQAARAEVLAEPGTGGHEAGAARERIWRHGWTVRRRRYGAPTTA
jgi:hypothetical protein